MKEQIQQVLKMNKEGKLTDEQAAELLAELARPESKRGGRADWDRGGILDPLVSKMSETLRSALDTAFSWDEGAGGQGQGQAWDGPSGRNSIHMSRFDYPEGKDIAFTGNVIRMSSVKDLRMDRSEMAGNTIDMSKADDLRLKDSKLKDCEIRASSVDDWHLDGCVLEALAVQGSRVADLQGTGGSALRQVRIQGSSLKDLRLAEGSRTEDLLINGSSLSGLRLSRSELRGSEIRNSSFADFALHGCRAERLMLRSLSAKQAAFADCVLTDVAFSAEGKWGWKKHGLKDVRFEGCAFEKVVFADCRFSDCVIRNVTLRDRRFRDLDLAGLRIDGTEAFLKAIGE
jgi:uncharacterized protein YjbI with pentapeptide repeats